uniref:Cuticle protein n=1 Tax=Heliothis virescens TaxID=7102 RepID=A0A2A4JEA6_HELVI
MFKLVVLCAFFAAAAAKPGALIAAPITQYSTFLTPDVTTITRQDSSVIHPSPLFYQAPLAYAHYIKKRSPQFPLTYAAPATFYPNYLAATTYNAPLIHNAPILPAPIASVPAVHLIKKRSAPLIPTTYYAPSTYAATTPLVASTYTATAPIYTHAAPLLSQPIAISQPLAYTHLIKKRSAALLNTFVAPTSYSHQSRFDLQSTQTPYSAISYSTPFTYANSLAYSSPLAVSHLY